MIHLTPSKRRLAQHVARAGTVISAFMLVFGVAATHVGPAAAAIAESGTVRIANETGGPLSSGGSATVFAMTPPSGAACPGSGAGTPSYRWQMFFVAASVDASALAYASGPKPVAGGAFVSPMYDSAGSNPVTNQNPSASPLGLISGIPTVSFSAFSPGNVAPGDYKIGFACTLAGATVSFWSTTITVVTDIADAPARFTWTVGAVSATTTSAATTTTAAATTTMRAATSTTRAATSTTGATTTTHAATTTSVAGSTTTIAVTGTGSTTATAAFSSSATPTTSGTLASTGTASSSLLIWAVLLLVFGRITVLLARPIRVQPQEDR